jgi:dTDP-4-amino-4,6-dideoxygalactose transaminase
VRARPWRQLPVYSPISLQDLGAALAGSLRDPRAGRQAAVATLCETYGAKDALLTSCGTAALRLALRAVSAGASGRPIALPAYSCYDLATAADGAGVDVVLYDLDPRTLGPDMGSVRRALEHGPSALVAAHLFGYPVDMNLLISVCAHQGVMLIEDAAQAAGGSLGGTLLGSFGSLSVLSFGRGKGVTTGAGGALLAHDDAGRDILGRAAFDLAAGGRGLRECAALAAQWVFGRPRLYGLPTAMPFLHLGETVYQRPARPAAMSNASVSLVRRVLPAVHAGAALRRIVAARLVAAAKRGSGVRVVAPIPEANPGYLRLPIGLKPEQAEAVVMTLRAHGVTRAYPAPLHVLAPFKQRIVNATERFPGAQELAETIVTLPTHSRLEAVDVQALESFLGGVGP